MNTRSRSATVGGMISASGGRTQTVQQQQEQEPQKSSSVLVLKLKNKSSIQWTEDTVDNENLGRKSSKSEWERVSLLIKSRYYSRLC